MLTIALIIIFIISFCLILNIYINKRPILDSITKVGDKKSEEINSNNRNIHLTKNFIYEGAEGGKIKKSNIRVDNSKKDYIIGFVYEKKGGVIDVYKTEKGRYQNKYTQNYLETIFNNGKVIISTILPDDYSEDNLSKCYGTKNLKYYSKGQIFIKDLLKNNMSGKLSIVTDKNDSVIRIQKIDDSVYDKMFGELSNNKGFKMTSGEFEAAVMHVLYRRFIYIIFIIILMITIINFALSKTYVRFALKPLIEFTHKIKEQSNAEEIKFVEVPKVNDEIYDLTCAYNLAMEKIKNSYDDLQILNSYASHELRNSLAILKAKLQLGDKINEIEAYIDKITNTTNDIMAMSTPKLFNDENVDLALVCAKVVDEYIEVFRNIELKLPDNGVELIKGKELWLERCVANLIDNAIKFVDKNKAYNEIRVEVLEDEKDSIIRVYDNGIGIDESKIDKIFEPYYGNSMRLSTGIGLAYVKHIMDLHKGRVLVKSKKEEYSEISLIFSRR